MTSLNVNPTGEKVEKDLDGSAEAATPALRASGKLHPIFAGILAPYIPCRPGDAPQPFNHTPSAHTPNYNERD